MGESYQSRPTTPRRNVLQILGGDFETPVERVVCWTLGGRVVGGTATALRLAMQYDIPIVNLATEAVEVTL